MFPFLSLCGRFHAADQSRWSLSPACSPHTSHHQVWNQVNRCVNSAQWMFVFLLVLKLEKWRIISEVFFCTDLWVVCSLMTSFQTWYERCCTVVFLKGVIVKRNHFEIEIRFSADFISAPSIFNLVEETFPWSMQHQQGSLRPICSVGSSIGTKPCVSWFSI